jgi:large subunit ribosomal protein L29
MQRGTGQLSRPDQMGKVRKDIARINTVINEKIRASEAS